MDCCIPQSKRSLNVKLFKIKSTACTSKGKNMTYYEKNTTDGCTI